MDLISHRIVECPCDGLECELASLLNEYEGASVLPGYLEPYTEYRIRGWLTTRKGVAVVLLGNRALGLARVRGAPGARPDVWLVIRPSIPLHLMESATVSLLRWAGQHVLLRLGGETSVSLSAGVRGAYLESLVRGILPGPPPEAGSFLMRHPRPEELIVSARPPKGVKVSLVNP